MSEAFARSLGYIYRSGAFTFFFFLVSLFQDGEEYVKKRIKKLVEVS